MTIKKRLFISNILMILIPAAAAVAALALCLAVFWLTVLPKERYELAVQVELYELRDKAAALGSRWLEASTPEEKGEAETALRRLAEKDQVTISLQDDAGTVLTVGEAVAQPQLDQALAALGGSGTVSNESQELYGQRLGEGCQLKVYNPVVRLSEQEIKTWLVEILFVMAVLLVFIIYLTNRFLTRFVVQKIQQPLEILEEGVRQIRDGNLTYRIDYDRPDEFRPVCEAFNEMARRLLRSVQRSQREEASRKELLASISHDVRSPLAAIQAYVEGLLDGVANTPEKQRAYLAIVRKKAMEMDQMIRQLFLFSKMDLEESPYDPQVLWVAEETADFIAASAEEYRRRGLKIQPPRLPERCAILADPTYFRSILMNLLDNSAKYGKKPVGTVWLSGQTDGQVLRLCVDDDGPGVPQEELPKLFDVFYRGDTSRSHPGEGSGLGLAIVAKAAARMGGSVSAENRPEGGLRVILEFPVSKGENDETHPHH